MYLPHYTGGCTRVYWTKGDEAETHFFKNRNHIYVKSLESPMSYICKHCGSIATLSSDRVSFIFTPSEKLELYRLQTELIE